MGELISINKVIDDFSGAYGYMSNFSDHAIMIDGVPWRTVEHWFHANKSLDVNHQLAVHDAPDPGAAKVLGRSCVLRPDWELIKDRIMWLGIIAKFTQHYDIRRRLRATGEAELIEGNTWHDNYWGDCFCEKCVDITGRNQLGKQLMQFRDVLQHAKFSGVKKG